MGAGKFALVAVNYIEADGQDDGDQGQLDHQNPVVIDPGPEMEDAVKGGQMKQGGGPDRESGKSFGKSVGYSGG
ncbi:hypothetical protein KKHLCK_16800 [Candidatus Electrothrix laxa]